MNDRRVIVAALIPRFFLGIIFLLAVLPKLTAPTGFSANLGSFLSNMAMHSAPAWYQTFLSSAVMPNLSIFAYAIIVGELVVAVSMILGIGTRVGALVAIFLNANYMLAKGAALWYPSSNDAADIMLALVVFLTSPGLILGIDGWFASGRKHAG
jgi:uncharacterized membrane protein YphA (DoxX/SURF4 family)